MHLTDEELNEYLDNEIQDRARFELHLSSCEECAARLTALKTLFAELDSLPELTLSRDLAAPFTPSPSLPAQLPRSLALTVTLQAAIALIAIIIAAPFLTNLLPAIQTPSLTDALLQLQSQWTAWPDTFSQIQIPPLPEIPIIELSGLAITLTLTGASMLWLVGNGLLLRNQIK